jgi:UDP-N-acetylglucosamine 1-carboxyvinyltransferase
MYFRIEGGVPLQGSITAQGAKNSSVHLMAAALLTAELVVLENVPAIQDVFSMVSILRGVGAEVHYDPASHRLKVSTEKDLVSEVSDPIAASLRASLSLAGPLLARKGQVRILFPGGCNIGSRPVNYHLKGFQALGADARLENGSIIIQGKHLEGRRIYLDYPSVGATVNLVCAATLARGETILENVAEEPEIVDLCNLLRQMGAKIHGGGTKMIQIKGVRQLHGATHKVIPDRIEGGTYLVAAAVTGGEVLLRDTQPMHLEPLLVKLQEAGVELDVSKTKVHLRAPQHLLPVDIKTMPYPGFPTDLQNQMLILLCLAKGTGVINETVFENRLLITGELRKMGADISLDGGSAIVHGVQKLEPAKVVAPNLRGGASLVLAALTASGVSEVHGIDHIDRGYEDIEGKLSRLGARIERFA